MSIVTTRWQEGHNWLCLHCHQREYAHSEGYCPKDGVSGRAVELTSTAKYLRGFPHVPRRVLINAAMLIEEIAREDAARKLAVTPRTIPVVIA